MTSTMPQVPAQARAGCSGLVDLVEHAAALQGWALAAACQSPARTAARPGRMTFLAAALFAAPLVLAPAAASPVHISLLDHGAACDGTTPDTAALGKAFAAAEAAVRRGASAAAVRVPRRRTCVTGPFKITANHTTLYLEAGSTLRASDDPALWTNSSVSRPTYGPARTLSGFVGLSSVTGSGIGGPGSLDMNGKAWHGGRLDPKNDYKNLPHFVIVHNSTDIVLQSATFLNGACWNIHLLYSTWCTIDRIRIETPFKGTDDIDVDSSTHVAISNSFISNGDDCIALKSGWDCFGIRAHLP
eukprot:SAG22_NODE_2267_length_2763_cov_3.832584_5_plen_300_part_01